MNVVRFRFALPLSAMLALGAAPPAAPSGGAPSADTIFARAKAVWRTREPAPFVQFSLLERYRWRDRTHDNWWRGFYRSPDRALALHRIALPEQDDARLKGAAISLNFRIHNGAARVDSLETNASADAFPVLDPLVEPDASFGLARRASGAALARDAAVAAEPSAAPATEVPRPLPSDVPRTASTDKPLRELVRVEAIARDYRIALVGTERIGGSDAYHLSLEPLRDPRLYRLRDVWVATQDYATVKLDVDGLFEGKPYDGVRWTVSYVRFEGKPFVAQIKTDETLHFGLDRSVPGLEYDFVEYAFPAAISPLEFGRLVP